MTNENFTFYEPTEAQLAKFRDINAMPEEDWMFSCIFCDDCSICDMAVHKRFILTRKHICTRGMSEDKFRAIMADSDCEY